MAHRRVTGAVDLFRLGGGAVGFGVPTGTVILLSFARRRTPTLGLPARTSTRRGDLGSTLGKAGARSVTGPALGSPPRCI